MKSGLTRRILSATLVATLAALISPFPAWSGADASWAGRVISADGVSPREGVVVNLVDDLGEVQARSAPTRSDGSFTIDEASAGEYRLLIETQEGAFLADHSMNLAPGVNSPVALALRGGTSHRDLDYGFGSGQTPMKKWTKWTIAGAIGVVAVFGILEVSEDEDEPSASPF